MALIQNVLVYEEQYAELRYEWYFDENDDQDARNLLTSTLALAGKNCEEAGKALLDFLDVITEKTNETN